MNKPKFSQEQMFALRNNHNVIKCSDKAITYAKDFKIKAVREYNDEGMTPTMIFREAGFDLDAIDRCTPKNCLNRWRRTFKIKGVPGLNMDRRGRGSGKVKDLIDAEKIKRLEIEIAYLKEENSFLAKLRAKRTE
jgi:transposase-like protein